MDGTDKVLHRWLVGEADQVLNVVNDEPRQVLRVMQVLTLRRSGQGSLAGRRREVKAIAGAN